MNFKIEQMQAVIEALPDPVFILTKSKRYADILGGSDSRFYHDGSVLVGKLLSEVLPKDKASWFLEQVLHALETTRLHTVEYALGGEEDDGLDNSRGPTGMLWFEGRIQPLDSTYKKTLKHDSIAHTRAGPSAPSFPPRPPRYRPSYHRSPILSCA